MRIKFFSSFCDSETCKFHFERVCQVVQLENYGPEKELYITTGEDYTHVIILNTAMPELNHIPKENVIGLAFEPVQFLNLSNEFVRYAQKHISKYLIGDVYIPIPNTNQFVMLPTLFKLHYAYIWHMTPPPFNYVPQKTRLMSIMVSEKKNAPGHQYRHTLVKHILSKGLPIDIYGRGSNLYRGMFGSIYKRDPRLKGHFKELEPYANYAFHICIENFMSPDYFSEKITNSLLCSTTPVYWGCTRILDYFPMNVIILSGDVDKDIGLLRSILSEPNKYKANIKLNVIKDRLNLLKNVDKLYA